MDGALGEVRREAALRRAIEGLPSYSPPAATEEVIFRNIRPGAKVIRLPRFARVGIAASVALVLFFLFRDGAIPPVNDIPEGTLAYSTEVVDPMIDLAGFDEDQEIYREILALCEVRKFTCEQDRFRGLAGQLEELNEAHGMLRAAIGEFGTDPDLVSQLTKLERERSGVLKELLQVI